MIYRSEMAEVLMLMANAKDTLLSNFATGHHNRCLVDTEQHKDERELSPAFGDHLLILLVDKSKKEEKIINITNTERYKNRKDKGDAVRCVISSTG